MNNQKENSNLKKEEKINLKKINESEEKNVFANNLNTDINKVKSTKNNKIIYTSLICGTVLIILIIISITIWFVSTGKIDFIIGNNKTQNEKVELKYTDSLITKTEGVYVTDVSEVVDEVMPSIVAITSKTVINSGRFGPSFYGNGSYTAEGAGSGVIVSEDDDEIFILTNYHVVENANELSVKFIDDKSYDATVKGVSERKDIAVVSVTKNNIDSETLKQIKIATLGNSNELKVGNGIIAIGNALGYGQSVTTGVVSALNREVSTDEYTQDMIQIDAAINGGNSGGALLNSKGEVVGINSVKYSSNGSSSSASVEGMGFAIPISDIESIIKTLISGKNDTSALTLGVEGYMTNSSSIRSYGLPTGFYISSLVSGGNADKGGLEIGNIITEIDGNNVTSTDTIKKVLSKKESGDEITLKIKYASRNEYKEREIKIILQ